MAARAALLDVLAEAQQTLGSSPHIDGAEQEAARLQAAKALDNSPADLPASAVDSLLLKPPWTSRRPAEAAGRVAGSLHVQTARNALCAARPGAEHLFRWLDTRAEAHVPYRRLTRRHTPWFEASVDACVRMVQEVRAVYPHRPPHLLIAEGTLGVEAAAAAAAGANVTVCEPNLHAARAIAAVSGAHGWRRVCVLNVSLEEHCRALESAAEWTADAVVLTGLVDESGLGERLLPSAAAAAAAAADAAATADAATISPTTPTVRHASIRPHFLPASLTVWGTAARLSAGEPFGIDLRALDAARWSPSPLALSMEEEGGQILSAPVRLFTFELARAAEELAGAEAGVAWRVGRHERASRHGRACRDGSGGVGGDGGDDKTVWGVNAIVIDLEMRWEANEKAENREREEDAEEVEEREGGGNADKRGEGCRIAPSAEKRAVHFIEECQVC